jgi:hypothetical protein
LRWTGHSPPRPEISTKADPSQTTQPLASGRGLLPAADFEVQLAANDGAVGRAAALTRRLQRVPIPARS